MFEEIKRYLQEINPLDFDQFTIDWIEVAGDKFIYDPPRSESAKQTLVDATHYEVWNVLEIMRADAEGRPFFEKMKELTDSSTSKPPSFMAGL